MVGFRSAVLSVVLEHCFSSGCIAQKEREPPLKGVGFSGGLGFFGGCGGTFGPEDLPECAAAANVSIGNAKTKKSPTANPRILTVIGLGLCKDVNGFDFIVSLLFLLGYRATVVPSEN